MTICCLNLTYIFDTFVFILYAVSQQTFNWPFCFAGESLDYGFVEFDCSTEKCRQIQEELDWHHIDSYPVHCDVVELTSYSKLSSRCLLIDNLPKDFTDVMALRDIFSKFYSPLYCQVKIYIYSLKT